jgi:hypothetical protein
MIADSAVQTDTDQPANLRREGNEPVADSCPQTPVAATILGKI